MTEQQTPDKQVPTSWDKAEVNATFQADDSTEVRGTVRIAPEVLIQLIKVTVSDIPGVIALTERKRRKTTDVPQPSGKAFDDGKVRVSVDGDQIGADISVVVRRDTNISSLADEIRRQVGIAAGRMLGMTVKTVNVFVEDIIDPAA